VLLLTPSLVSSTWRWRTVPVKSEIVVPAGGRKVRPAQLRAASDAPGDRLADIASVLEVPHRASTLPFGAAAYPPSATHALFG
jgi:hypothetical protein